MCRVATDHFQKSQSQDGGLAELLLAYSCLTNHSEAIARHNNTLCYRCVSSPTLMGRHLSGIQRAAQTVLGVYLKRTCSRVTSASSALAVLNDYALYESTHSLTHTHPFNDTFSGTTRVSRCQKGKTNLDFTEARDSGWQWHQLEATYKSAPRS